jgi:predicted phosphodiesterase
LVAAKPRRRYVGRPGAELRAAAGGVARVTGASRVVFGHTHVEEDDGVYFNLGSFTYPKAARSYGLLVDDRRVERAWV